jgi:predicted O-linked N-acetylglucosamine transferase (SPINDLY family)
MTTKIDQARALHRLGQIDQARALCRQLLQLQPRNFDALTLLGIIAAESRDVSLAAELFSKAVGRNPRSAVAHSNLGNVLQELGRFEAAIASYDRALAVNPNYSIAHNNRGNALRALGRFEAAIASYRDAIRLGVNSADVHFNCGDACRELGQYTQALACYEQAIRADPNRAVFHNDRGNALHELQQYEAAIEAFGRAIALEAGYAAAYFNRGNAYRALTRFEDAAASYERALALQPELTLARGLRLHCRMQQCSWDEFDAGMSELATMAERDQPAIDPFSALALSDSPRLLSKVAANWVSAHCPPSFALPPIPHRPRNDRIRVGYFSADFCNHALAVLAAGLFETHDRAKFELTAFSLGTSAPDQSRARLASSFDRFVDAHRLSDRELALLARSLEIDIAVDLGGFTTGGRPRVFAMRAAPVQVSYLGFLGTTAIDSMDYIIADRWTIPAGAQQHYSEKVAYLTSYQVNDSKRMIASAAGSREQFGLPSSGFVFCCFNASYKITPAAFALWMRLLARVPASVLFLLGGNAIVERNLRSEAGRASIDPNRLVFGGRVAYAHYLARYAAADLFLDTWPYNAGTTASDALWMGLPIVTRAGESFASRVAASVLDAIDMPELITSSDDQYEQLAARLAAQPQALAAIKERLRAHRGTTRLFDTVGFTRQLEQTFERMYERSQAGDSPGHIHIKDDQQLRV